MTLNEAADLLDLPMDATPAQVDARLAALLVPLRQKIIAAPAGYLRDKHLNALAQLTAAADLLKLSASVYQPGTHGAGAATVAPFSTASASMPAGKPASPPAPRVSAAVPAEVPVAPRVAPRGSGPSRRSLAIMVLLILIGGGGGAVLLKTRWAASLPATVTDSLPGQLATARLRWARLEAELVNAERLRSEIEADSSENTSGLTASTLAENRARVRAQDDFIAWCRSFLNNNPAQARLDRLIGLIAVRDFAEALKVEAALGSLLDRAEAEMHSAKTRLLALDRPLLVESEPAGLRYTLIDSYGRSHKGQTPAKLNAPWGLTRLTVVSPGAPWDDWRREFTVDRDMAGEMKAVFAHASLRLSSVPDGLAYELSRPDGKSSPLRGLTPAELSDLPTGQATLRVSRPGWPDQTQTIEIAARPNAVTVEFIPGAVSIISEPMGATVSASGRTLGVTPLIIRDLPPGEHAYSLALKGRRSVTLRAKIEAGVTALAQTTLELATGLESGKPYEVEELGLQLMPVPAGSFIMGSSPVDPNHDSDETQYQVVISRDFWLGKCEVTRAEWRTIMEVAPSPSDAKDELLPVTQISWEEANAFCRKLTARERAAGRLPADFVYALPTEAQWEYACRAGTEGLYGGVGKLDDFAWYQSNSGGGAHPVGQKPANAWGLHDMHGNVWEWCADWFQFYPTGKATDPAGPRDGVGRVNRGGGWGSAASTCRSATRLSYAPTDRAGNLGFRVAIIRISSTDNAGGKNERK